MLSNASVFSAVYYVDNSATGSATGTSWANAWTSLAQVRGVLPDDTVYISGGPAGGTRTYRMADWVPVGGSRGHPVNYRIGQDPDHGGTIVFDGLGVDSWWLKSSRNALISGNYLGQTNIVVKGYKLAAYADSSSGLYIDHIRTENQSVRFLGSSDVHLSFCYIQAPVDADYVIQWGVTADPLQFGYADNSIMNCVLRGPRQDDSSGFGADFIQAGSHSTICSNLFSSYFLPKYPGGQHQDGIQNNESGDYVRICANIFENISNYCLYWEFIGGLDFSNLQIYNNIFRHNASVANASGLNVGIVLGPQGVSGHTYQNILVANNSFADMYGRSAIAIGQPGRSNTWINCQIVNNLMVNCGNPYAALSFDNCDATHPNGGATNGVTIAYNIAIKGDRGSDIISPGQLAFAAGSTTVQFVRYSALSPFNDLGLNGTAPLGVNLSSSFGRDAASTQRPAFSGLSWAVGAYERRQGPNPPVNLRIISN